MELFKQKITPFLQKHLDWTNPRITPHLWIENCITISKDWNEVSCIHFFCDNEIWLETEKYLHCIEEFLGKNLITKPKIIDDYYGYYYSVPFTDEEFLEWTMSYFS